jgi:hypothetical protein
VDDSPIGPQVYSVVLQLREDIARLEGRFVEAMDDRSVHIDKLIIFIGGHVDLSKITENVGTVDTLEGSIDALIPLVAEAFKSASNAGGQKAVDALAAQLSSVSARQQIVKDVLTGITTPVVIPPVTLALAWTGPSETTAGTAFGGAFAASGGTAPYSIVADGTLPDGLTLDAAGNITGAFAAAGIASFGATVTDAAGATASATASVNVS